MEFADVADRFIFQRGKIYIYSDFINIYLKKGGGNTIMVIIRNGKEIELTWDEVSDAHKEFVTSWMSGVAISDFDVDESTASEIADRA